jgi:hypothetical protein
LLTVVLNAGPEQLVFLSVVGGQWLAGSDCQLGFAVTDTGRHMAATAVASCTCRPVVVYPVE